MATATATRKTRKSDDERQAEIEQIKATFDGAVLGLNSEAGWEEMVTAVADFGAKYSFGNQLLILAQADARGFSPQMVMSFNAWKKLGRCVVKGEKSLKVWAPARYKRSAEECQQLAAKRGGEWDGKPEFRLGGFRLESVFDISQTEGDDVELPPSILVKHRRATGTLVNPVLLTGDDDTDSLALVVAEIERRGWTFELAPASRLHGANGHADPSTKTVRVRDDVDGAQQVKTAVHELAHVELGHTDDMAEYGQHRGRMETEAESVAHIVLKVLGADTDAYSAPYVASWSRGDKAVLEQAAKAVVSAAQTILRALEPQEEKPEVA